MPNVVQPSKTWVLKTKTLYHNINSHAMPIIIQLSNKNKTLYHMPNVDQPSKT